MSTPPNASSARSSRFDAARFGWLALAWKQPEERQAGSGSGRRRTPGTSLRKHGHLASRRPRGRIRLAGMPFGGLNASPAPPGGNSGMNGVPAGSGSPGTGDPLNPDRVQVIPGASERFVFDKPEDDPGVGPTVLGRLAQLVRQFRVGVGARYGGRAPTPVHPQAARLWGPPVPIRETLVPPPALRVQHRARWEPLDELQLSRGHLLQLRPTHRAIKLRRR